MANISILSRIVNGVQRQVDLSVNTLVVQALSTGTNTLTDTILGRLLNLQNGTDLAATYHTHDTLYTRSTALTSVTAGSAGSTVIGDNNSYTNFTPSTATVKGALSAIDTALATVGKTNFSDGVFYVYSAGDATKKIALSATGITTGNTRTITMPDANVNLGLVATAIQAAGTVAFTAAQSMGGFKLTNVANGTVSSDAANYGQVLAAMAGNAYRPDVNMLDSVDTVLPTNTSTLIDGITVTNNMRVLFTNLASGNNDIYKATVSGSTITWTVTTDGQSGTGTPTIGDTVLVVQGTNYANLLYAFGANSTWVQITGAGQIVAGNGLSKTGQTLAVVAATGSAIAVAAGGVSVTVAAAGGIQVTSSALQLFLADTSLSTSSSGVKVNLNLTGALSTSTGLKVNVDNSAIIVNGSNALTIGNNGITSSMISTAAVDGVSIVGGNGTPLFSATSQKLRRSATAGQAFSANTTYALRWGLAANGETAGTVYAADPATASFDLFYVIGCFSSATAVSASTTINFVTHGLLATASSDPTITTAQTGLPVFLVSGGLFSATAPTTSGSAVVRLGIVTSTSQLDINPVPVGVN